MSHPILPTDWNITVPSLMLFAFEMFSIAASLRGRELGPEIGSGSGKIRCSSKRDSAASACRA